MAEDRLLRGAGSRAKEATAAPLRVAVVICSVGRPDQLGQTLHLLKRQTRWPSQVVLAVTGPSDLPDISPALQSLPLEFVVSQRGLTRQRNAALKALMHRCDVVFFMDDDYLAEKTALEAIKDTFAKMPNVTGVTGRLLADGINSGGLDFDAAADLIVQFENRPTREEPTVIDQKQRGLYGCNMAFRMSRIGAHRFDENLPLYGWQEDVDFANRLDGKNIRIDSLVGVHCGTPLGRETHGAALGYSQIANPLYLMRKGSMQWRHAAGLITRNLTANIACILNRSEGINRPAQLWGNMNAFFDLLSGQIHPTRIRKWIRS